MYKLYIWLDSINRLVVKWASHGHANLLYQIILVLA